MVTYEIDGDTITIDEDRKGELNKLAARFYARIGYTSPKGFDFSTSLHPQEQAMWSMAVEAYYMHVTRGIFD
ncbi:hypothetical protein G6355_18070 [Vibrio cholerae]|uniref:hypothetical protein n=1 Tax=Vibrio cholerae TaxID=666 RepID=UPI0006812FE2|nr:hypothetical protein [Vibrio cholerae]EGR4075091.1 hypothetical protein [Vibrio cholerae]ELO1828308.1 hypothetical protein [Vibrio cholerae]MBY4642064.1 hypothetical protein [Vibrio cholerae]MCR9658336.1 hypothetical protein [Vibrio cholerae]MCR9689018.1 hypothetical protein [Vibrio cholerae]